MKLFQTKFLKSFLFFALILLNSYNAYSVKPTIQDLLKEAVELRENFRAAIYNVELLKLKIESEKVGDIRKDLENQLSYEHKQSLLYDANYSRSIEIILDRIKELNLEKRDAFLEKMYNAILSSEKTILENLARPSDEKVQKKILTLFSQISVLSLLLNRFDKEFPTENSNMPYAILLLKQEWCLLKTASFFSSSEESIVFQKRLSQIETELLTYESSLDGNTRSWKANKATYINQSIHFILGLKGINDIAKKPGQVARDLLNAEVEINKTAFAIIDRQWSTLESIEAES